MNIERSFDWAGFKFFQKILLICVIVGTTIHYGLSDAERTRAVVKVDPPQLAVVQTTAPIADTNQHVDFSTTTPERVINAMTIADAVSPTGKFIAADLVNMKLTLYNDAAIVAEYPILTKGRPKSPYETPSGFYAVLTKETNHLNNREQVYMPYSMQFYGNYFIHGWPYYTDGTPVASSYSGGCIRLSDTDAKSLFAFADKGTGVFVYDPVRSLAMPSLVLSSLPNPLVSAESYLVADIDTGDVFLEKNAQQASPISSLTKLMTALVANETIMFNKQITIPRAELLQEPETTPTKKEIFFVGDLLYPLLMESNSAIADRLAQFYGKTGFIDWMNVTAKALNMHSTHFADASGVSAENSSTPDDLYRLARYLATKKSFIFDITRMPAKRLIAMSGRAYSLNNLNIFSSSPEFAGGKVGQTGTAGDISVSLFATPINGISRRVAIVVLNSSDYAVDTTNLSEWFSQSAQEGAVALGTACASCARQITYRKIQD